MSAIQQLITNHLDIWTSAETEKKSGRGRSSGNGDTVYGIKKLRELILELAVRGKLVPQDPNDEPASELLKRIQAEKARLVKEGKIRKGQPLQAIADDEVGFELPGGWHWIRLGQLGDWGAGATPLRSVSSYYGGDMPWFKSGELNSDFIESSEETVSELALQECSLRLNVPGDVLIAMYGATIGKASILKVKATTNQAVCACTPFAGLFNRYLLLLLKAMRSNFVGQGAGGAQPNISREKIIATVAALPPEAEQHRIVAKVDELMALCDQLETQHNNATDAHEKLVSHLLGTLTQSRDAADFNASWQRIAEHFDTLFTTENSIDALKQSLLQLAVMGKLVPQDSNDEPASELLKRIQAEKAKLIAAGKIKKEKPLPPISDEEMSLDLPNGWWWIRFNDLANAAYPISYGVLVPGMDEKGGVPFVRIADLDLSNPPAKPEKSISKEVDAQYSRTRLEGGEILMGVVGSVGKLGVAPKSWKGANIARAICRIKVCDILCRDFVVVLLQSRFMQHSFIGDTRTLAQPTLNVGLIRLAPTPIPPVAEQRRIVSKFNELMALCDQLKSRITDSARLKQKLADALVEQAVSAT